MWSPTSKIDNDVQIPVQMKNPLKDADDSAFGDTQKVFAPGVMEAMSGFFSRVMEECQQDTVQPLPVDRNSRFNRNVLKKGGSILEVLDGMVKVGQAMGYDMGGCLGSKAKKDWTRELVGKYKVNFLSLQETKMEDISFMDAKFIWGNSRFEHITSKAIGNSGGILCIWDPNIFLQDQHTISNNFVAISVTWIPSNSKLLIISIYAPQSHSDKRLLWGYISSLISRWQGDSLVLGDFNEVRNRHLSDHHPILLREVLVNYGATPFRFYHSWLSISGFDLMVSQVWKSFSFGDSNDMIQFKKKLQASIDQQLDQGVVSDDLLLSRMNLMKQLHDFNMADSYDILQKAKIKWAIEGDENSKFFHGVVNKKRANLAIKGIMVDGDWVDILSRVKDEFCSHFTSRFQAPCDSRSKINFPFPNRLNSEQATSLETPITTDEIRSAVWACGENKSPGPDGFTFEFFQRFWDVIGPDFCLAVKWFFDHNSFAKGCNSSFIALIPKVSDPKFVNEYRPISLIGSLYKVVIKILGFRLVSVLDNLISEVQSAFLPKRQILDGPFVINEVLSWCKHKRRQAMIFKVDFAKAYDSVRWDFLDDVLLSFGFGLKWRAWILGSLSSGKASVLVNGSPTSEFQFHCGLKQGDPLAPYLFILVMESLHLSFARIIEAGFFKGLNINNTVTVSHLFYADDAVFVGEWSDSNLSCIMNVLHCFSLASGLKINIHKSHLLGVGVSHATIEAVAASLGCSIMKSPFIYLGVPIGGNMSSIKAWDDILRKLKSPF
ncbi:RNA-directed DNA polymerase, eukaryota [Tanacetum coccineum]